MKSSLKISIILLFFAVMPLLSSAQIPTGLNSIEISTYPEFVSPGKKTEVSLESFSTDLNVASIVWLVDGKSYSQGIGMKSINVTSPTLGKQMNITAIIKTVEGMEIRKNLTISPASVDLIWESQGYIPPFFDGKGLFVYENPIKVVAIPQMADKNGNLDPKKLLYKWTVNDRVIQDQSGYGKQTLRIQDELPKDLEITVEVSTPTGTVKASNRISLSPGDPSISFYEEDPLYGVLYNKSLVNRVTLENQEITIRAVPFGFNIMRSAPPSFNWSINNLQRNDLSTNESITLRTKGDVEGSSSISLDIRNSNNILQGARNSLGVFFTKKKFQNENNVTF